MQIILTIVHQFRSISTTLIDLFVLFELISLLHLILIEEKMTIHQLLFVKNYKGKGLKVKDKIDF
jgi:hypothetical protein